MRKGLSERIFDLPLPVSKEGLVNSQPINRTAETKYTPLDGQLHSVVPRQWIIWHLPEGDNCYLRRSLTTRQRQKIPRASDCDETSTSQPRAGPWSHRIATAGEARPLQ